MSIKITADYRSAFKQADIRGIYPSEINEEVAYLIARSFVDEYKHQTVLVARDMRLSSPVLHEAFCKGITDAGADVIDLGLVTTPMLYFASGSMNLPGVVITASHSPKQFNGFKLVLAGAIPLTENKGLKAIRKRIEKGIFSESQKSGKIKTKDIRKAFQSFVFKGVKAKGLEKLKVVVDVGNGMSSVLKPILEEKLPIKFDWLFTELDGRFPNRGSDPTLKKNQKALSKTLKEGNYDFGIAFDGDADRIAFQDEKGNFVNSSAVGALIAEYLLKKNPKAKIGYTVFTGRDYEEKIKNGGGVKVPTRVGHTFIKETMRQKDILFACEHSGHYYYKEYFYTDSAVLTLRYVLEIFNVAKARGITFSEMMKPYLLYKQTENALIEVRDTKKSLEATQQFLLTKNPLSIKIFDGVTIDLGDTWGVVKVSVTEQALNIMFESEVKAKAQLIQDELVVFVRSIAND